MAEEIVNQEDNGQLNEEQQVVVDENIIEEEFISEEVIEPTEEQYDGSWKSIMLYNQDTVQLNMRGKVIEVMTEGLTTYDAFLQEIYRLKPIDTNCSLNFRIVHIVFESNCSCSSSIADEKSWNFNYFALNTEIVNNFITELESL